MTLNERIAALVLIGITAVTANAQMKRRAGAPSKVPAAVTAKPREIGSTAFVIDETLSVLRPKPSLFAEPIQRMRRGRKVQILGTAEADGVKFYRIAAQPNGSGWVQADAVFGSFRAADEERMFKLIQASTGFDQLELAAAFFELFPTSRFRPTALLLFGDLAEEAALKLTREAANRLDRREMAATAAPLHSYYLNFVMLDRYRKLGITYLFDPASRAFHYDGATWKEIERKFAGTAEAAEAEKRLGILRVRMEKKEASAGR